MNKIERLCKVIDFCMDKIISRSTHIGWYNYFNTILDTEIEKDLTINVDELQISSLMKVTVKRQIDIIVINQMFNY